MMLKFYLWVMGWSGVMKVTLGHGVNKRCTIKEEKRNRRIFKKS